MEALPSEVFALILAYPTRRELQTLRLVNKRLAAEAAPNLFRTISAWISLRSLQKLTWLSEHPYLSHLVRTLIISSLRVIDRKDSTAVEALVRRRREFQHESLSSDKLSLARYMVSYRSYLQEQRLLRAKSLGRNILSQAFNQFTNLEEIAFPSHDNHTGAQELIEAFGISDCTEILTMDFEDTLPTIIEALGASHAKIKLFSLGCDLVDYFWDHQCDCSGNPESSSSRCARLSKPMATNDLPIESRFHQGISDLAVSKALGHPILESCRHVLGELRELYIGELDVDKTQEALSISRITTGIRSLISLAPNLEIITLRELKDTSYGRPFLGDIFSDQQYKNLREISIDEYDTTERALVSFIKRHSYTLVDVQISFMVIVDTDWSSALSKLRDFNFPHLRSFVLNFCLGWDSEKFADEHVSVHEYVLRKTDKDPTIEPKPETS